MLKACWMLKYYLKIGLTNYLINCNLPKRPTAWIGSALAYKHKMFNYSYGSTNLTWMTQTVTHFGSFRDG